jgi:ATP-dependent DNA helicase PIF1
VPVVLGGDFRQILPVIEGGSRAQIVGATITNSPLWKYVRVIKLEDNMRLSNPNLLPQQQLELKEFSEWVLAVGDGKVNENDGDLHLNKDEIKIPNDLLLNCNGDAIGAIIDALYGDLQTRFSDVEYLSSRAIVCPNNDTVDAINERVLQMLPGDSFEHLSCDSMSKMSDKLGDFDELYNTEYLNSITISNFPHHKLILKVGCPVMLLRNIDQTIGLCNGTRLLITRLATRVVEATIMTGSHVGDTVYIPRITLTSKKSKYPFVLERRQYPIRLCYAMTINKSQ